MVFGFGIRDWVVFWGWACWALCSGILRQWMINRGVSTKCSAPLWGLELLRRLSGALKCSATPSSLGVQRSLGPAALLFDVDHIEDGHCSWMVSGLC